MKRPTIIELAVYAALVTVLLFGIRVWGWWLHGESGLKLGEIPILYILAVVVVLLFLLITGIFFGTQRLLCGEHDTPRAFMVQMLVFAGLNAEVSSWFRYDFILRQKFEPTMAMSTLFALGLVGLGLWWGQKIKRSVRAEEQASTSLPRGAMQTGLFHAWAQEVGTGESGSDEYNRMLRLAMLGTFLTGMAIGYYTGGGQGALIGGFLGGWLASLAPRDAVAPDLRLPIFGSGAAAPRAPRPISDAERRADALPVTRFENCEAFVSEADGELWFCVARGDSRLGPLPVVDRVPWRAFQNFEEGSHARWFRARTVATNLIDWDVVILQSNTGQVIKVAESVHDHAGIVQLLGKLQSVFIAGRHEALQKFDGQKRDREAPASPAPTEGVATAVPF